VNIVLNDSDGISGAPCFAATRVPIQILLDHLKHGGTREDFLEGALLLQRTNRLNNSWNSPASELLPAGIDWMGVSILALVSCHSPTRNAKNTARSREPWTTLITWIGFTSQRYAIT